MAFEYKKGLKDPVASISNSPYWILVSIPFKTRFTLDTDKISAANANLSKTDLATTPAKQVETKPILFLDNHCIQWSVSSTKSTYSHSASFTLVPPFVTQSDGQYGILSQDQKMLYNYDIAPSDWVMFWAMDNKTDYERVKELIRQGKPANDPSSGLKFVGRVTSFRSICSIDGNGVKIVRFQMDCHGFKEFDNVIYYNDLIYSSQVANKSKMMSDLSGGIHNFLVAKGDQGLVRTQNAIPTLVSLLFDANLVGRVLGNTTLSSVNKKAYNGLMASPNRPYYIPKVIGDLLGVKTKGTFFTYPEILTQYVGVYQYFQDGERNGKRVVKKGIDPQDRSLGVSASNVDWKFSMYWPDNMTYTKSSKNHQNLYQFKATLSTLCIKQVFHFDGRNAWSILNTYLTEPMNEMYTSLLMDPEDQSIRPSLVCRALPFTSVAFAERTAHDVTRFVELPRWNIDEAYLVGYDIGLTDSVNINFVKIEPQSVLGNQTSARALNLVKSPPELDSADAGRNGVRMYLRNTTAAVTTKLNNYGYGNFWTSMMSDIMMRMRYTSSGRASFKGIQECITIGDNLVLKDMLFHIEGITHSGGIDGIGRKSFNTNITLTHGIKLNEKGDNDMEANYISQQLKNPSLDGTDPDNLTTEERGATARNQIAQPPPQAATTKPTTPKAPKKVK
jgi:hypothetical protein